MELFLKVVENMIFTVGPSCICLHYLEFIHENEENNF